MTITILALDVPERPRIIKLPRNGPKPGQSVEAWLYGKNKNCQRERDAAQWGKAKGGASLLLQVVHGCVAMHWE